MHKTDVSKSYQATSVEQQKQAYNEWAEKYEADLCAMGYRIPAVIASLFVQHVDQDAGPILDAGCGGGIQAEPLVLLGYGPIIGIDLSEGMLEVARQKNIYSELKQATLGETLSFADDTFSAVLSAGTITPRHAPAHSFEEIIRITKSGAPILFSMRDDPAQEPAYPQMLDQLESEGKWRPIFKTDSFHSMPYGEPEITHRVHVYQVC